MPWNLSGKYDCPQRPDMRPRRGNPASNKLPRGLNKRALTPQRPDMRHDHRNPALIFHGTLMQLIVDQMIPEICFSPKSVNHIPSAENQKGVNAVHQCSVENQKAVNAVQQCSVENQKGVNAVQRCSEIYEVIAPLQFQLLIKGPNC